MSKSCKNMHIEVVLNILFPAQALWRAVRRAVGVPRVALRGPARRRRRGRGHDRRVPRHARDAERERPPLALRLHRHARAARAPRGVHRRPPAPPLAGRRRAAHDRRAAASSPGEAARREPAPRDIVRRQTMSESAARAAPSDDLRRRVRRSIQQQSPLRSSSCSASSSPQHASHPQCTTPTPPAPLACNARNENKRARRDADGWPAPLACNARG
mmetsp:Transcript_20362/g.67258  ORF Transcript_20362/g.67258 Transcript_20362/m.67258 type:complete len:215 (+) Transcript_20362:123-767(+)